MIFLKLRQIPINKNFMKKVLNKRLDEKAMLAGMFAFAALGFLYLYVAATVNNTEAPTKETSFAPQKVATTQVVSPSENGMKKYVSDFMKVEFEYPKEYSLDEKISTIILKKAGDNKKPITFAKYGTNFESVKSHVDNVVAKWKVKPDARRNFFSASINGEVVQTKSDGYSIIFFVKDYAVYQFETGDESLFPDLEKIAKSFKILE